MKRLFIGLALVLVAYSGVATAGDAVQNLQLDAAYVVQGQGVDYDAVLAASSQAQEATTTTTRLRSDMRVASTGLVFDRAEPVRSIQRLVPC